MNSVSIRYTFIGWGVTCIKRAACIGSFLLILSFTMQSNSFLGVGTKPGGVNMQLFHSIQEEISAGTYLNTIGNVVLFVPYGLMLGLIFKRNRLIKAIAAGAGFSLTIEFIQLFMPNRWTDIDDVLLNTFGTMLGCIVALLFLLGKK